MTRNVLFLCSSAGLLADADEVLSPELMQWARCRRSCRAEPMLGCFWRENLPSMAMPVVLTATLRAIASDVGSGSCRCTRLYNRSHIFQERPL